MTVRVEKPSVNLREKLAELDKPTGIAGEAMLRAETPQEQFNLIGAGRRNILINGNFDVWQRGTSWSGAIVEYTADRWKTETAGTGVTATYQQTTDGTYKITTTGSGTGTARIYQIIEMDFDKKGFGGKTFTASAWVKSNTSNARLQLYPSSLIGWSGFQKQHSGNGSWEYLSFTFVMPNNTAVNSVSLQVGLDGYNSANVAIISGDYVEVKEVQLELGKVATPFEHRSYGEELALCQRYFRQINSSSAEINIIGSGLWDNSTNARAIVHHPIEMRTAPTYTASSGGHLVAGESGVTWRTGTGTSQIYTRDGFSSVIRVDIASSGATNGEGVFIGLTSGSGYYVRFDAEL